MKEKRKKKKLNIISVQSRPPDFKNARDQIAIFKMPRTKQQLQEKAGTEQQLFQKNPKNQR